MGFSASTQMVKKNKTKIKEYKTIVSAKYVKKFSSRTKKVE